MSFLKRINILCDKYPYTTQAIVASVLYGAGDVIAQKGVEKQKNFDYRRCANFAFIGAVSGVVVWKWFSVLQMKIHHPKPLINAVRKVAGNIIITHPIVIVH